MQRQKSSRSIFGVTIEDSLISIRHIYGTVSAIFWPWHALSSSRNSSMNDEFGGKFTILMSVRAWISMNLQYEWPDRYHSWSFCRSIDEISFGAYIRNGIKINCDIKRIFQKVLYNIQHIVWNAYEKLGKKKSFYGNTF